MTPSNPGPTSQRAASDSLPPGPNGGGLSEEVEWCVLAIRALWKRLVAHEDEDAKVHEQVAELRESVGVEGNRSKGRSATGLHLAVETGFAEMRGEMAALAGSIREALARIDADRTARQQALLVEETRSKTLAEVRAPWAGSWLTARNVLLGLLITSAWTAVVAIIVRHVH